MNETWGGNWLHDCWITKDGSFVIECIVTSHKGPKYKGPFYYYLGSISLQRCLKIPFGASCHIKCEWKSWPFLLKISLNNFWIQNLCKIFYSSFAWGKRKLHYFLSLTFSFNFNFNYLFFPLIMLKEIEKDERLFQNLSLIIQKSKDQRFFT